MDLVNFAFQYKANHPDADTNEIVQEYNKTKQGKQAMNTRLLGG